MLNWAEDHQPSLAHPVYSAGTDEDGGPIAGFPEVRAQWHGFCLDTIHCVGVRRDLTAQAIDPRTANPQLLIPLLHELAGHWPLAHSPLGEQKRLVLLELFHGIVLLGEGQDLHADGAGPRRVELARQISVPLRRDPRGHLVERAWHQAVAIYQQAAPLEEAFAVWCSLHAPQQDAELSPEVQTELARQYQERYEAALPGFIELYNQLRDIADLGLKVAFAITFCSLRAAEPVPVFHHLVQLVREYVRQGKGMDAHEVVDLFVNGRYRSLAMDLEASIARKALQWPDEALPWWKDLPDFPFVWAFDAGGLYSPSGPITSPTPPGSFLLPNSPATKGLQPKVWLESVRQQLCSGRGLICPFWASGRDCGQCQLLANIRAATDGPPTAWVPQGCLTAS